jgi:beta-glucanase (GH16 family)
MALHQRQAATFQRRPMLYGRVEVRAKLPRGVGSWPAIWMLPEDARGYGVGWPDSGEIDIMEHVGYDQGNVHFTVHTAAFNHKAGTHKTGTRLIADAAEEFHVYGMELTPEFIRCYVDGETTFSYANDQSGWRSWPFDKLFYLILNIACGGDWGGREGIDNDSLPWRMEVDWVRVYHKSNWTRVQI